MTAKAVLSLNDGADAAYDRQDRAWFTALTTGDLETLWAQVSGPNFLAATAGPWDDEVYDALDARGWFKDNGINSPTPKDIWATTVERN